MDYGMAFLLSIHVVEASSGCQCHHFSTPYDWSRSVGREGLRTRLCPADRRRSLCQPESYSHCCCRLQRRMLHAQVVIVMLVCCRRYSFNVQGECNLDYQKSNPFVVLPDGGIADYILTHAAFGCAAGGAAPIHPPPPPISHAKGRGEKHTSLRSGN